MESETYFYNCSGPYLDIISPDLHDDLLEVVSKLPKREYQSQVGRDLFWLLTAKGWSYDAAPAGTEDNVPRDLGIETAYTEKFEHAGLRIGHQGPQMLKPCSKRRHR